MQASRMRALASALFATALFTACEPPPVESGPVITAVSPEYFIEGDVVTIQGHGFGTRSAARAVISSDGSAEADAPILDWSDTEIRVRLTACPEGFRIQGGNFTEPQSIIRSGAYVFCQVEGRWKSFLGWMHDPSECAREEECGIDSLIGYGLDPNDTLFEIRREGFASYSTTPVEAAAPWQEVAIGTRHSCGIQVDGTLWCWGPSFGGAIGHREDTLIPQRFGVWDDWISVTVGAYASCGVRASGAVYCWGFNHYFELALSDPRLASHYAYPVSLPVKAVAVRGSLGTGESYAGRMCAIPESNGLYCWGFLAQGDEVSTPTLLGPAEKSWQDVFAHVIPLCAIDREDGMGWCLGLYADVRDLTPIDPAYTWSNMTFSYWDFCGVTRDHAAVCSDDDELYAIDLARPLHSMSFYPIANLPRCVMDTDGQLFCIPW